MEFTILYVIVSFFVVSKSELYDPCYFDNRCRCSTDANMLQVDCSRSNITVIPEFPSNVKYLYLQYNCIKKISNKTFANLKHLTELDLSRNRLYHLELCTFIGLGNLQRLILENNTLNYFDAFPKGLFKPLISLTYLNVKFNAAVYLSENFPDIVISDLSKLESLEVDASYEIGGTPFGKGFSSLTGLTRLRLGYCSINYLDDETFSNLKYLEFLDLSRCFMRTYYKCSLCHANSLKHLDISYGRLYWDSIGRLMDDLPSTSIEILIMTRVFANTIIQFPTYLLKPLYNTSIQGLRFNYNFFVEANMLEELPETLKSLDFSYNYMKSISLKMPYLLYINLRNNSLGDFLASHRYMQSTETRLKILDLSSNTIHTLVFSIFHGHTRLEMINLSHNSLQDITFDLSQITTLQMMDLSYNYIRAFNQNVMNAIGNIFKKSDLKIDLSNNILQCSCRTASFFRWILDNLNHFLYSHKYKCKFDNGTVAVLKPFRQNVLQIEKDCASYTVLIVSVSIGIVAACIVLVVGLIYRYRWKLRYMYYMTKSKYQQYKPINSGKEFTYDAFISYSDDEQDFVVGECIPNLEQNRCMKLCIHQRDFLPGEEITVNITNAIHESKKTICIITRSFLDSYYCMFEFNMARMESIYSRGGENILFLVFYDQIMPRELPLVLLELVQQQSYIEYPHDTQGNVVFWEKIRKAVG